VSHQRLLAFGQMAAWTLLVRAQRKHALLHAPQMRWLNEANCCNITARQLYETFLNVGAEIDDDAPNDDRKRKLVLVTD
jgi:hypothetical protein